MAETRLVRMLILVLAIFLLPLVVASAEVAPREPDSEFENKQTVDEPDVKIAQIANSKMSDIQVKLPIR